MILASRINHHDRVTAALILLVALVSWSVIAGGAEDSAARIEVTLVAEVREEIEVSPGRRVERLVPAGALRLGQEIWYTVRIRNTAAVFARDVEVVQRIPENTTYVPGSAAGPAADILLSADGAQTFAHEGQLTVVDQSASALAQAPAANHESLTRAATPQDYTHIRWHLRNPLAPGAVALARFRAVFR